MYHRLMALCISIKHFVMHQCFHHPDNMQLEAPMLPNLYRRKDTDSLWPLWSGWTILWLYHIMEIPASETILSILWRTSVVDSLTVTLHSPEAPVTQNSTSKSRTRGYENLVDVVISGNFWSILAWPCLVRGMAVSGCSTAEALPKHCLCTA